MSYQSLYKIYLQNNNDTFNKIYNERLNSTAAIKFPIEINNSPAFFFYDNNIMSLLNEIREYDHRVNKAFSFLPEVAKYQYIKQSLIDEIHFTNQIEGVISTRKDIFNILEDIKANNKEKQRLEELNYVKSIPNGKYIYYSANIEAINKGSN